MNLGIVREGEVLHDVGLDQAIIAGMHRTISSAIAGGIVQVADCEIDEPDLEYAKREQNHNHRNQGKLNEGGPAWGAPPVESSSLARVDYDFHKFLRGISPG